MNRDLEHREERRQADIKMMQEEGCDHCSCCRVENFCCWCDCEDVGYDPGDDCDAAYDSMRDDGI